MNYKNRHVFLCVFLASLRASPLRADQAENAAGKVCVCVWGGGAGGGGGGKDGGCKKEGKGGREDVHVGMSEKTRQGLQGGHPKNSDCGSIHPT